jgi:hypothetical protein
LERTKKVEIVGSFRTSIVEDFERLSFKIRLFENSNPTKLSYEESSAAAVRETWSWYFDSLSDWITIVKSRQIQLTPNFFLFFKIRKWWPGKNLKKRKRIFIRKNWNIFRFGFGFGFGFGFDFGFGFKFGKDLKFGFGNIFGYRNFPRKNKFLTVFKIQQIIRNSVSRNTFSKKLFISQSVSQQKPLFLTLKKNQGIFFNDIF